MNDKKQNLFWEAVKRFTYNKAAVIGAVYLAALLFIIIFANVLVPVEKVTYYSILDRKLTPCAEHWFGTDNLGRDLFARVIYGTRITVGVSVGATLASLLIGASIASVCALNHKADFVIMRMVEIFNCIPSVLFAMVLLAVMGGSVVNLIITMTIVSIPGFIIHVRSILFSIMEQDYIKAARLSGTRGVKLVRKHILPNAVDTMIVDATMTISGMMLSAAGMSAIGLGISPPSPEWGAMINAAAGYYRELPHMLLFPAAAVVLTALAINLVGDGLRDALDPKAMK